MGEFKLVHCNNQNLLDAMHNIRERVLFTDGKYDKHHPDDTNPDNQCFVFLLNDKPIATVRLDFIRPNEYAIRLVAVLPDYQGKKIGSKMMNAIFDYANQKGIYKLVTNAAIEATKFYESLGFEKKYWIDTGEAISRPTIPMIKELTLNPELVQATISDYPTIQNMARFYVYDMSRYCGFISDEWAFPKDGLYESHDFKKYFIDKTREAFLVKIKDELAGFVLLNKIGTLPDTEWNMGEFFIIAKFQGKGIAREVTNLIWKTHPGKWEVSVIPENDRALNFWRKTITHFTNGHYDEVINEIEYDKSQPKRYILSFDINEQKLAHANIQPQKSEGIEIEEINKDQAEALCRSITQDLPEYFGIPSANEQYFAGVRHCINLAAKINNQYVGLLSLNFPYLNNSNIYWMAVFRNHQDKGVGHHLIDEACWLARKQNANSMTVETLSPEESDENYLKTYRFYQSLGFKPLINIKPEGYEWNMVYMVKQLITR